VVLTREDLCRLIPHAAEMCLLEEVLEWDASAIVCIARNHRDAANPLRGRDRLHAVCGVEYAAQAMAIHGALRQPPEGKPQRGYLAAVRALQLKVERLDDIDGELHVRANHLMGDSGSLIYEFSLSAGGRLLMEGRASVLLINE
jgi:predicted hotdog family 3-hydroxylacyl-ACP dehydratase